MAKSRSSGPPAGLFCQQGRERADFRIDLFERVLQHA
jgi:hypothetical protein